ncbi:MAG TPA: GcrA family cell cycle regulator [Stellaceae bacterium]
MSDRKFSTKLFTDFMGLATKKHCGSCVSQLLYFVGAFGRAYRIRCSTMESIWTNELVDQLSALWQQGLSTAEIGRKLGISKNAVVGKAHRLMLTPRPSPLKSPPIRHAAGKAGPTCSWPHGHPGQNGFRFCGKRVVPGKPYCPEHAAMAYIQPKERKVQAA